jgi:hypothetical protein
MPGGVKEELQLLCLYMAAVAKNQHAAALHFVVDYASALFDSKKLWN